MAIRALLAVGVLLAIFGFALPRLADYDEAWAAMGAMTGIELAVLVAIAAWNLATYWPMMVIAQPGLRLREAAIVNQASTAVANTVPGGGALAVGVSVQILRRWGFSSEAIANQTVITGVWNQLVKLGLPMVAVVAMAASGDVEGSFIHLAAYGALTLGATVLGGIVVLRNPQTTRRFGSWLDRALAVATTMFRRPRETTLESWLLRLRTQLLEVVGQRALLLSVAAVISHLSLFAVLLACLRMVGVTGDQLPWSKVLLGFALVRLLSAIPITPGGVGVVELGYVGFLATGDAAGFESPIAAAVLVFRAITYAVPIVLGAMAWIFFQRAESWRRPPNSRRRNVTPMMAVTR